MCSPGSYEVKGGSANHANAQPTEAWWVLILRTDHFWGGRWGAVPSIVCQEEGGTGRGSGFGAGAGAGPGDRQGGIRVGGK